MLLLVTDRRLYEPLVVRRAAAGPVDLRERLALTLAALGDPRGLDPLLELLDDPEPRVRRSAAFALGLLGEPESRRPLLAALLDRDRETGIEAAGALARLETPIDLVAARAEGLGIDELWQRILPFLHRYRPEERRPLAVLGLELDHPELRRAAAYALTAAPRIEDRETLRRLLAEPDATVRGWAAAALGRIGTRDDLDRLLPLLEDGEGGVAIAALEAAEQLVSSGRAAARDEWRPALLRRLDDRRPPVRLAAAAAAAAWLLDPGLGEVLVSWAAAKGPERRREREVALLALARARDPRAEELLAVAALESEPSLRRHAARGAGWLGNRAVLDRLREDSDGTVRAEVLRIDLERLRGEADVPTPSLSRRIAAGLDDSSPVVQEGVLAWLLEHPLAPVGRLAGALERFDQGATSAAARIAAVDALVARAESEPGERAAAIEALVLLARDRLHVVRRRATTALDRLGETPPELGAVGTGKSVAVYRQILQRTAEPRRVGIETTQGRLEVELDCTRAPLACLNFLHLANQGFYSGQRIFRRDGRIESGGPREDGGGYPGFFLRDEPCRIRFSEPGMLALSRPLPDGASSRFFLTLEPQPQLDGERAWLGRVTSGLEVLDRLVDGDRLVRISEVLR